MFYNIYKKLHVVINKKNSFVVLTSKRERNDKTVGKKQTKKDGKSSVNVFKANDFSISLCDTKSARMHVFICRTHHDEFIK